MGYPYGIIDSHAKFMMIVTTHFADDVIAQGVIGATIRFQLQKKRYEIALERMYSNIHHYTVTKAGVYTLPDMSPYLENIPNRFGELALSSKEVTDLFTVVERNSKISNLFKDAN